MSIRYQIKVLDGDLLDIVHELATQVCAGVVTAAEGRIRNLRLYPAVFAACRDYLRARVRAFHVCGCAIHCSDRTARTELASADEQPLSDVDPRSPRIRRYVIDLDVPVVEFARELERLVLAAVSRAVVLQTADGKLREAIQEAVEPVLGRYLYSSQGCNEENFLCRLRECTQYDPWERVLPKA
jgi:hypothetical protein